eukprot:366442-Chlamydomonas_euryale.AAC.25
MSLPIKPSPPKKDPRYSKLSVTDSSLPGSFTVGNVMGRPIAMMSAFPAFMKSPHFKATASTTPISNSKSSGESASHAKSSACTSATVREIRSVGNAPPDLVIV